MYAGVCVCLESYSLLVSKMRNINTIVSNSASSTDKVVGLCVFVRRSLRLE